MMNMKIGGNRALTWVQKGTLSGPTFHVSGDTVNYEHALYFLYTETDVVK